MSELSTPKILKILAESGEFETAELEDIVEKLSLPQPDDIPRERAKAFHKPFEVLSDTEITLNGKTVALRKLKFLDAIYIAQCAPQAVIYLFGKTPEEIMNAMDPVEVAYTVFFAALTDSVDGELTDFAVMVLRLVGKLLSNNQVTITTQDILTAEADEIFIAFQELVAVNVHFFVSLRRILPANIKSLISFLGGTISSFMKPISDAINLIAAGTMSPQDTQDSAGGMNNGSSMSTKPRSRKKATASKKSTKAA